MARPSKEELQARLVKARKVGGQSKADRMSLKEYMFVSNYVQNGGNATQALYDSKYNPKSKDVAIRMASNIMKRPKIQNAILEKIKKVNPQIEENIGERFKEAIQANIKLHEKDRGITVTDLVKLTELYMKLADINQVKKHAHVHAKVNTDLPDEEK